VILVDSSVWIDHLRGSITESATKLRLLMRSGPLLVGDLVLCEIMQGLRANEVNRTERALRRFEMVSLCDPELAIRAAANYRFLRSNGITVRNTIDMIIGTFCIERGYALLHSDRDFEPMERLLGLRTV
jgi:predicted nucleic acid-binding protein